MLRKFLAIAAAALLPVPASSVEVDHPASFAVQDVAVNGTTIHVRAGGTGPAVLLPHGFGDTGDMWVPLAVDLARGRRPVLMDAAVPGLGGEKSMGATMAKSARYFAVDVKGVVIPDDGHWLMEEKPGEVVTLVTGFLRAK